MLVYALERTMPQTASFAIFRLSLKPYTCTPYPRFQVDFQEKKTLLLSYDLEGMCGPPLYDILCFGARLLGTLSISREVLKH